MERKNCIEHQARVLSQCGNMVKVAIRRDGACSSCQAKSHCRTHSDEEMEVECYADSGKMFSPGEQVTIVVARKMGKTALLYGYVYPLVILMVSVIVFSSVVSSQALAALLSLLSVAIYYVVLKLFGSHIEKEIKVYIK